MGAERRPAGIHIWTRGLGSPRSSDRSIALTHTHTRYVRWVSSWLRASSTSLRNAISRFRQWTAWRTLEGVTSLLPSPMLSTLAMKPAHEYKFAFIFSFHFQLMLRSKFLPQALSHKLETTTQVGPQNFWVPWKPCCQNSPKPETPGALPGKPSCIQ